MAQHFRVRIIPQDWVFDATDDSTLFQSARAAGIRLPTSCRNGTCRACICLLTAGRVRHIIEWPGLSAEEKVEGWFLPCVAEALDDIEIASPLL